jgi:hypothetical protein
MTMPGRPETRCVGRLDEAERAPTGRRRKGHEQIKPDRVDFAIGAERYCRSPARVSRTNR